MSKKQSLRLCPIRKTKHHKRRGSPLRRISHKRRSSPLRRISHKRRSSPLRRISHKRRGSPLRRSGSPLYKYLVGGNDIISNSNDPALVKFFAPWCGHCEKLVPVFDELDKTKLVNSDSNEVLVHRLDCVEHPHLAKKHNIQGFPTIRYYKNGLTDTNTFEEFNGDRSVENFVSFVNKQ